MTTTGAPVDEPKDSRIEGAEAAQAPEVKEAGLVKRTIGKIGDAVRGGVRRAGKLLGGFEKADTDQPENLDRRDFLRGRITATTGTDSAQESAELGRQLTAAVAAFAAISGIEYAFHYDKSKGGFVIDAGKAKIVDHNKIQLAGFGAKNLSFLPFIWHQFGWGLIGAIAGVYLGNKFIRSPKESEMAAAEAKRDVSVGSLSEILNGVGMMGNAPGQVDRGGLANPNMDTTRFAQIFAEFNTAPNSVLDMLAACRTELTTLQGRIPVGAAQIPQPLFQEMQQIASRYTLSLLPLPANLQLDVNDPTSVGRFLQVVQRLQTDPGNNVTQQYVRERTAALQAVSRNPQAIRLVEKIKHSNLEISREVPFFRAIGDVIRGDGEVNRRQFMTHIGGSAVAVGSLAWGIGDPSLFGETPEEAAAAKAKKAEEKARKGLETIRGQHSTPPEGKPGQLNQILNKAPDAVEARPEPGVNEGAKSDASTAPEPYQPLTPEEEEAAKRRLLGQ